MFKAFRYRIFPTENQMKLINNHIGASRFVFNLCVETKKTAWLGSHVNLSAFDLMNQLTDLKKDYKWLNEVNAQSLQATIRDMDNTYKRFFKGKCNYPKFKKKASNGSFTAPQHISVVGTNLIIPKFKEGINIVLHREITGNIKKATITRSSSGKYHASLLCEISDSIIPSKTSVNEFSSVGIDLGIKDFAITSEGEIFDNPKFLRKAQSKLKYIQRKFSKNKGKRTKQRLALLHEKVANQRKDFLHKTSTKLIRENQTICIEDLNVAGMVKNHKLAFSISDSGWSEFVRQLEYKANWYGKNILKIGRFEPSSKTCSCCGNINRELTLKDRTWTCVCGVTHDRDLNASINIKNFALKNYFSGTERENRNELPELLGVTTYEAEINP